MKDAMGIVVGVVITVVALVLCVNNTFVPFKNNQEILSSTNNTLMASLQSEIDNSTSTDSSVTGSSVKATLNSSVGNSNVKIYIDGTLWDGKSYENSNVSIDEGASYKKTISASGGITTYRFIKS